MNYIFNWEECKAHILSCYPNEGGGIVTSDNIFHPIENISEHPIDGYEFGPQELAGVDVKCILHSHTYDPHKPPSHDPRTPSKTDLQGQIDTDVEWAIVVCEGENVTQPIFFGDYDHRPELFGEREFIHNIQDCLSFMSDWQYKNFGLKLPAFPRDFYWIEKDEDHIEASWPSWGFVDVSHLPQATGDVILYKFNADVTNHVSVVVEPNRVAHHLPRRFPKSEPYAIWSKYIVKRIRHVTNPAYKGEQKC